MPRNRTILLGGTGTSIVALPTTGGTTNVHAKFTGAFSIGDSIISDDGTTATVAGRLTVTAGTLASTTNALALTGTLASVAAAQIGANFNVTSAGSAAGTQDAMDVNLLAGYTGSSATTALAVNNATVGTNVTTATDSGVSGNTAVWGYSAGTTIGIRIGVRGTALGGVANVAGFFHSQQLKNAATNIGVLAYALNLGTTPTHCGGYFGLLPSGTTPTFPNAALCANNGATTDPMLELQDNGTASLRIADGGLMSVYKGVTTSSGGWGLPAIYGAGTIAGTVNARSAAVTTYTAGASDGSFEVSGNVLVTASATHSFSLDVSYTDESNAARVMVLPMAQLAGTFVTTGLITNVTGLGPYESPVLHIRCKASTAITIRPSSGGTYTSVTYNTNASIKQIS